MNRDREIDPAADSLAWREAHLPELTPARVAALKKAGFDADRLRHLARTTYGRSLAVSVLVCFTDAYPQAASVQDVARAGEANRRITSRSSAQFEKALAAHGLHSQGPRSDAAAGSVLPPLLPGRRPTTSRRWWLGWSLALLLALFGTTLLASLDFGIGAVLGAVLLAVGWLLLVRRLAYGPYRNQVPKRTRLLYAAAAVAFVIGSAGAADAVMLCFGQHGVGRVDSATQETGTHGTVYTQCSVDEPDGSWAELRFGGACPGPEGTPVPMFYFAGGDDSTPWRPVPGTAGSVAPLVALWGVGTLVGCGLLTRAALTP
ncbi:hypothetical protein [Streptacidiphilus jiangxiensis]|uniref:Uncharacterized protein n=1 Tax=Streptacidiphilus jiangxiensis TaxID=235985 RepID=A0A1H7MHJ6_STRJI|nr:hypothetical protein [Streptacidiphilus jiangxiensis]SEL10378.1 hypothetical protein SAMN05414137_105378 [Streptacidiphilus jiangxiensis]